MPDRLTLTNVVDHLIADLPELNNVYAKLLDEPEWRSDRPGAYIVYGHLFIDYIVELSKNTDDLEAHAALTRAMKHLEKLSADEDEDIRNLSEIGVLEQLFATKPMECAAPFMGPATRSLAIEYGVRLSFPVEWIKALAPADWVST